MVILCLLNSRYVLKLSIKLYEEDLKYFQKYYSFKVIY